MDLITAMEISASGLSAQRTRLNIISMNIANAQTTRTADGGPYRRRVTVFKPPSPLSAISSGLWTRPSYPAERRSPPGSVGQGNRL